MVDTLWAQLSVRLKEEGSHLQEPPSRGQAYLLAIPGKIPWKVREFKEREDAWIDRDPLGRKKEITVPGKTESIKLHF